VFRCNELVFVKHADVRKYNKTFYLSDANTSIRTTVVPSVETRLKFIPPTSWAIVKADTLVDSRKTKVVWLSYEFVTFIGLLYVMLFNTSTTVALAETTEF
jgi:hypothetical protein